MPAFRISGFGAFIAKILSHVWLAAIPFVWIATPKLTAAQAGKSATSGPLKYIFLLPDGFRGWVCVDFNIAGAPPLPHEGDASVITPRPGDVLATSDKAGTPMLVGTAWYVANGERKPLPNDVYLQEGVSGSGSNEPTERQCDFVGTTDEREAAGDRAPGFENLSRDSRPIPTEERIALETLYKVTDGDHWKHHVGWMGAEGTECDWHGIICGYPDGSPRVISVVLPENNLTGSIPDALAGLRYRFQFTTTTLQGGSRKL